MLLMLTRACIAKLLMHLRCPLVIVVEVTLHGSSPRPFEGGCGGAGSKRKQDIGWKASHTNPRRQAVSVRSYLYRTRRSGDPDSLGLRALMVQTGDIPVASTFFAHLLSHLFFFLGHFFSHFNALSCQF